MFSVPWRATKHERIRVGKVAKGLFLHIELVQPRRRDSAGGAKNDAVAPTLGFSQAQYDKLSQLYIAASRRAGQWMIPAYHAVLDTGIKNGHDDPQRFKLSKWSQNLQTIVNTVSKYNP